MWQDRKRLVVLVVFAVGLAGVLGFVLTGSDEGDLIERLASGDPSQRVDAVRGLEEIGSETAGDAIAAAADDQNASVASQALSSLGRLGRGKHLLRVRRAAEADNAQVREAAMTAMGGFGESADVDLLVTHLADAEEPPRVRAAAALSLGRLDKYRAMPALISALEDPDPMVRGRAYSAIRRILQLDVGFHARDPVEKRQRDIARIRRLYEICADRHADYVERMKEIKR